LSPTHGPKVIDVQRLYHDTGYFTFDPGYPPRRAPGTRTHRR
jgi:hypothetical protein